MRIEVRILSLLTKTCVEHGQNSNSFKGAETKPHTIVWDRETHREFIDYTLKDAMAEISEKMGKAIYRNCDFMVV